MINNSRAGAATYEAWLGVRPGSVGVIYNGIDVDQLQESRDPARTRANRERLGLPEDASVVGSLLRFSSEKRPKLWLEAAARVAERDASTHFVLIGDGVERARAEDYSRELGLADRVHFLGLIKDVVPWYDLMDVVLLTSSREGTSNTALEAQALGKPIIAPDVGGMAEAMVHEESGFLVSADPTADEIAGRIEQLLNDASLRRNAGLAGEAFIRKRFSIQRMARDTLAVYELDPPLRRSA